MATQYQTIGLDRLKEFLDADEAYVVNVLESDEYAKQHIPGSLNIPEGADDFGDRFRDRVPDLEAPIVVYCADEECQASPRAAEKLTEMGYENVYDYEEGMQGWIDAGEEVEGKTEQIRADVSR